MTFKRIVAFGCSCTVGEWLPGWELPTIENNWLQTGFSEHAWPFVLAKKMAVGQVNNLAFSGFSNHEILHRILKADLSKDDLVVVAWSYSGREILFDTTGITQTMWQPIGQKFYAVHELVDLELKSMEYVHHAQMYLENRGIQYAMAQLEPWHFETEHWIKYNRDDYPLFKFIDLAEDNSHPGIESHKLIAEKIYNKLEHHRIIETSKATGGILKLRK
jgi:hypothetical protein